MDHALARNRFFIDENYSIISIMNQLSNRKNCGKNGKNGREKHELRSFSAFDRMDGPVKRAWNAETLPTNTWIFLPFMEIVCYTSQ